MVSRGSHFLVVLAFGSAFPSIIPTVASSRHAPPRAASDTPNSAAAGKPPSVLPEVASSRGLTLSATARFDIPTQPLSSALLDLGRQADISLMLPSTPLEGFVSAPLHGPMPTEDALAQILRCLPFRGRIQDNTLIITYRDGSPLAAAPPSMTPACEAPADALS
jgi:hypothetical protein